MDAIVRCSAFVASIAAMAAACTSTPTSNAMGSNAPDGDAGGPPAPDDAGGSASDAGGPSGGANGYFGMVVSSYASTKNTKASAAWLPPGASSDLADGVSARGCAISTVGPCTVLVCPVTDPGNPVDDDAGNRKDPTAGTVTITGGPSPLTLTADPGTGLYDGALVSGTIAEGAALAASATGAEVPAFGGIEVQAPSVLSLTSDVSTIDDSKDLLLAWTGGTTGTMRFGAVVATDTELGSLTCKFDASARSGTVPSAALSKLPACSDPTATCSYDVRSEAVSAPKIVGDYQVGLGVSRWLDRGTFKSP